jgi:hypothetical protein
MKRILLAFVCFVSLFSFAQSSPFLPDDLYRKLTNEISGDSAFDHLRALTQYHAPNSGSRGYRAEADWVAAKAKEVGLEDVKVLDLPFQGMAWSPISCELWLLEPGPENTTRETRLISCDETPLALADNSRPTKLEAQLVDVGSGLQESDYAGKDVKGKVVLADGPTPAVERLAVKHGAIGLVSYWSSRINDVDYPDQIAWSRIRPRPDKEGNQPTFAIMISRRMGMALKQRLTPRTQIDMFAPEPETKAPELLRVRVSVESEVDEKPVMRMVEGWIHGKNHDQQVVLTAHMQEEKTSANDDRSGVANLLEIGRALTKMLKEGKLKQPDRDIRFWWADEISSEYTYFAVHPEDRKNIFVNINQDMVGADARAGALSRIQQVTFTPWSRPTFFNDVLESIITALYKGNNSYLSARQAGALETGSVYTKPIYSLLGPRDRYSIELVPFFDSTDHLVFNDGIVGAVHGGTTFTNWPDEYVHSSDDDIWQVDRTMMKRNAVAVTALAWYMANVGVRTRVPQLANAVAANGIGRIYRDARVAFDAEMRGDSKCEAENIRRVALERELAALDSIRTTFPAGSVLEGPIDIAKERVKRASQDAVFGLTVGCTPQAIANDPMARVPVRIDEVNKYLEAQQNYKHVKGMHGLMAYEAMNFVDGKRTVHDIYDHVRAESLVAGDWYYGTITPEMINEFFTNVAETGVVSFKTPPPAPVTKRKKAQPPTKQ